MKKKYIVALFALALSVSAVAQNGTVSFFSDKGEKFWVLVNGVVQNAVPENNVKVQGLSPNFYRIKIVFQIDSLGEINQNVGMDAGVDYVYIIRKKNTPAAFKKTKGPNAPDPKVYERYVLRPFSAAENGGMAAPTKDQEVIVYGQGEALNTEQVVRPISTVTVNTTTTTGGQTATTPNTGFSLNMNIDPNSGNMNLNMNGTGLNVNTNTTSPSPTTTTTTKTTTTTTGHTPTTSPSTEPDKTNTPVHAMYSMDFDKAVASIKAQSFEENKLMVAKQVLKGNYLNCAQIKTVMKLFSFEATKLDFAKLAYGKCVEKNNYYLINDAFEFSSSVDDLNEFIESK